MRIRIIAKYVFTYKVNTGKHYHSFGNDFFTLQVQCFFYFYKCGFFSFLFFLFFFIPAMFEPPESCLLLSAILWWMTSGMQWWRKCSDPEVKVVIPQCTTTVVRKKYFILHWKKSKVKVLSTQLYLCKLCGCLIHNKNILFFLLFMCFVCRNVYL